MEPSSSKANGEQIKLSLFLWSINLWPNSWLNSLFTRNLKYGFFFFLDLALEGLELEDLLSELHALKKLYGLLQKRDVTVTNGDSSHEFVSRFSL